MTLVSSALALAEAGVPVFPCWGDKSPATEDGFKSATTNLNAIRLAFSLPGVEMIGCPTGVGSGLIILDVDAKADPLTGATGLDWSREYAAALPDTRVVKTRSGGYHYYYRHPGVGTKIRNDASMIAPGVDVRGDGGYAIIPPSPGYDVVNESPIANAPDWLLSRIMVADIAPAARSPAIVVTETTAYGRAALEAECAALAATLPGSQDQTLVRTSFKIGCLVAGGHVDRIEAEQALISAGLSMVNQSGQERWSVSTVTSKVERGVTSGMLHPRGPEPVVSQLPTTVSVAAREPVETAIPIIPPVYVPPPKYAFRTPSMERLHQLQPRRWLYGRELIIGYPSMLGAPGGTGKSALALVIALSVASGKSLLAIRQNRPTEHEMVHQRGAVLYLNTEDPSEETERRLFGILKHYNLDLARDNIEFQHASSHEVPFKVAVRIGGALKPSPDLADFIHSLRDNHIKLLVVDPFVHSHEANENDNTEIGIVMGAYKQIAQQADCAVWLVHHTRKGNGQAGPGDVDTFRGAAAIKDGGRVMSTLKGMTADEAEELRVLQADRKKFVRLDNAKANMSEGLSDVTWYKLGSEHLDNGTPEYPNGDSVQVIERWTPPLPTLARNDMFNILRIIGEAFDSDDKDPYVGNRRANQWAGRLFVEAGLSSDQAASVIRQLLALSVLSVMAGHSKGSRKEVKTALAYHSHKSKLVDKVRCDLVEDVDMQDDAP